MYYIFAFKNYSPKNNEKICIQDVFYGDIDTMDKQADFTYDPVNFAGLPDFVDEQRAEGLRYVPIIDPAIPGNRPGYETYERGLRANAYVTTATGDILFGNVIYMRLELTAA